MNLKFSDCLRGQFFIAELSEVGRKKKHFFDFMVFNSLQVKIK